MSSEPERQDWAARRRESKRARKKNAVLKYLAILFAEAFVLLLYSYFAQQRSNREAIDNLQQTSNSAAQTLQNIIDERDSLKEENTALNAQIGQLEHDRDSAQHTAQEAEESLTDTQAQVKALNQLNQLRTLYNKGRYSQARTLLEEWESAAPGAMEAALTTASEALTEEERALYDPLAAYQNLVDWLG